MEIQDSVVVVTGGASGIGRAMATRFVADGAAAVVVADRDGSGAEAVATELGTTAVPSALDVADEAAVVAAIESTEVAHGPIDLWCGNAGILAAGGAETSDELWSASWDVNVMAHVLAARHLVPRWRARGSGHMLITASAAGLITQIGTAPYAVTKHAAVAFAEWLAITHGEHGVGVSCLCPQGVRTAMTEPDGETDSEAAALGIVRAMGMLEPDEVAAVVSASLAADEFMILPHPEVATYEQRRAGDRDRWLGGMRKLQRQFDGG